MLGARRDGTVGVDTSRGLLVTVLGELVLPHGGSAWTQTLVSVMEASGVRDKATRQALARMEERGWLDRERVGRRTRWGLTDHSRELLEIGADRIYGFGQMRRVWNGTWLVLLASVPERDRKARYRMGLGLGWAGFGSIGQGVWLSPWPSQEGVAVRLLDELGVEATSFRAELGELGSASELAQRAWDLPQLRSDYEAFLSDASQPRDPRSRGVEAVSELVAVVHRWRRFPFLDPDLPAELLPVDWPGSAAARRFATAREELLPAAHDWWRTTEASHTPADRVRG